MVIYCVVTGSTLGYYFLCDVVFYRDNKKSVMLPKKKFQITRQDKYLEHVSLY